MYWLWKWIKSCNNCTFSTWKDKFLFNLLSWIPNSFCTFHDYGREELPSLPPLTVRHWLFIIQIFEQLSRPEKHSCPETFHCVEIHFIFQDFWETCACPEKQSVFWIHCIEYIFFIIHNCEQLALALKNRVCPEIFHCIKIFFTFQDFWGTCACPENFHCIEYSFYIQDFSATCACPEKQSVPWNFSLHWSIFIFQDFWGTCACPENKVCHEIFHCI